MCSLPMRKHQEHIESKVHEAPPPSDYCSLSPGVFSFAECRYLLHQVHSAQRERDIKSILFLSQFPREGKTFVASVLAKAAVSLLGQRVLIVDTDSSNRSTSHSNPSPERPQTQVEGGALHVVAAKRLRHPNRSEHTERNRTGRNIESVPSANTSDFEVGAYLATARENYDLILIDGCSLRAVDRNDFHPWILARYSDSIIVVISPASSDRDALAALKQEVSYHHEHPLGFVFNQGPQA